MHPEWLTSTVTACALCGAAPSSHSTSNFTLEIMRLWLRNCAQRSCTDLAAVLGAEFGAILTSLKRVCRGPEKGILTLLRRDIRVNSTFLPFFMRARGAEFHPILPLRCIAGVRQAFKTPILSSSLPSKKRSEGVESLPPRRRPAHPVYSVYGHRSPLQITWRRRGVRDAGPLKPPQSAPAVSWRCQRPVRSDWFQSSSQSANAEPGAAGQPGGQCANAGRLASGHPRGRKSQHFFGWLRRHGRFSERHG